MLGSEKLPLFPFPPLLLSFSFFSFFSFLSAGRRREGEWRWIVFDGRSLPNHGCEERFKAFFLPFMFSPFFRLSSFSRKRCHQFMRWRPALVDASVSLVPPALLQAFLGVRLHWRAASISLFGGANGQEFTRDRKESRAFAPLLLPFSVSFPTGTSLVPAAGPGTRTQPPNRRQPKGWCLLRPVAGRCDITLTRLRGLGIPQKSMSSASRCRHGFWSTLTRQ